MAYREPHFWNMDIRDLARLWFDNFWTLTQVMMLFAMLALPVVIPALLMLLYQMMTGTP